MNAKQRRRHRRTPRPCLEQGCGNMIRISDQRSMALRRTHYCVEHQNPTVAERFSKKEEGYADRLGK